MITHNYRSKKMLKASDDAQIELSAHEAKLMKEF
jgi:hypothetical protein